MAGEWSATQRVIDFFRLRKRAYQLTFQNPKDNEVLKDLARFCHANRIPPHADLYRLGVAAGRREVWLRIMRHLNLTPEEIYQIYGETIQLKGD